MFVEFVEVQFDKVVDMDLCLLQEMKEQSKYFRFENDFEVMEGEFYNICYFWFNFEIVKLSWFCSKEYEVFFEMMD